MHSKADAWRVHLGLALSRANTACGTKVVQRAAIVAAASVKVFSQAAAAAGSTAVQLGKALKQQGDSLLVVDNILILI